MLAMALGVEVAPSMAMNRPGVEETENANANVLVTVAWKAQGTMCTLTGSVNVIVIGNGNGKETGCTCIMMDEWRMYRAASTTIHGRTM